MIERGGNVVIRMLENVQRLTIEPIIKATIAQGATVYTDEYAIYKALEQWGYEHETVCHGTGEYARDDDQDGFCEIHINTLGRILVTFTFLATSSSRHLTGEIAALPGLFSVCP